MSGGAPSTEGETGPSLPLPHSPVPPSTAEAGAGQAPGEEAVSLAPGPPVQQGRAGRQGRAVPGAYKRQAGHRGNELSARLGSRTLATRALPAPVQPLAPIRRALRGRYGRRAHRLVLRRSGPARGPARR